MPGRDVFICHSHLDKITHALPFSAALNSRGISCWLDEAQILPGESIIEKVGDGLRTSRFVAVLVTNNFLERNWPQKELNAALSREIRTGEVIVVPVVSADLSAYFERYPLMEDKLHLDWQKGAEALADHVAAFFPRTPSPDWHCNHPKEHVGLVWARLVPSPENVNRLHMITLRWGPYIKTVEAEPNSTFPISFAHHKTQADSVTLHVSVAPPSVITFGQGPAPDDTSVNIDEGWTRTSGGQWPGHL